MRRSRARTALLVAVLALAACGGESGGGDAAAETPSEVLVDLEELNGSGQTGTATLTPSENDFTMVTVETVSYLVDPQPVFVYVGSCDDADTPAEFELATIEDGISVTTVEVSLPELLERDYAISVRKSRKQRDVAVSCGKVPTG